MKNFQSMCLATAADTLSPPCTLDQVEIILRRQFEYFGGQLDAFKLCAVVQQCVRVHRDFHKGEGTIYLGACAGSKHCQRPCLLKGDGCLLFQVLGKSVGVGEGSCALCQSRKRRKLEHPSVFAPHRHLTAEDAVKRLEELTLENSRLKQQLGYTRRLLEKQTDSLHVEEDDECLQNLVTDAAKCVGDNENASVKTLLHFVLQRRGTKRRLQKTRRGIGDGHQESC
jgi:hypothetical protein